MAVGSVSAAGLLRVTAARQFCQSCIVLSLGSLTCPSSREGVCFYALRVLLCFEGVTAGANHGSEPVKSLTGTYWVCRSGIVV